MVVVSHQGVHNISPSLSEIRTKASFKIMVSQPFILPPQPQIASPVWKKKIDVVFVPMKPTGLFFQPFAGGAYFRGWTYNRENMVHCRVV